MCIIAVSKKGVRQPSLEQLKTMYNNNPDGAGYMFARKGKVFIHKGFMTWEDFERNIKREAFDKEDPVVYHFRISTQAGVSPQMTHPFPLTNNRAATQWLDLHCDIGVAHNGVIHMTSDFKETRFSDTAIFITDYMCKLIRNRSDMSDDAILSVIDHLTNSKWAVMSGDGDIETVGIFKNSKGLLFSNDSYKKDYKRFTKIYDYDWGYKYLSDYGISCK